MTLSRPAILAIGGHLRYLGSKWELGAPLHFLPDSASAPTSEMAETVEVVICGGDLSNALIDALPKLRLVASFATGYDGIDLARLRARGIALTTAAGVNAHDVADHAIALLLAWWHGIPQADRVVRSGAWREGLEPRPSLRGRKAGVVGLGRIGTGIARRLASHDIDVRWWGPHDKPDAGFERAASLIDLARWSDILVVATRAVAANARQIDAAVLEALGPGGVLINVSRGMLVDEDALLTALRAGTIGGAALDVFAQEPTDAALWSQLPNVVVTPHIAGYTQEARVNLFGQLRENVRRYLAGEPLLTPVEDS